VLTASIAHEIDQPLTGILTNASTCLRMLANDPPNLEGARATARGTMRDAKRAAEITRQLRALLSHKEVTREAVNLNDTVRDVIALTSKDLREHRVLVLQELADGLPLVGGDRVQLQQVVLNLVLNALDAMKGVDDRSRQLVVRTERREEDTVCLSVRDSGMGFESGDGAKLFEAFYTTKSSGMGIGLFVSRSIVESHEGRIWAVPNDGPGATFSLTLPSRSDLTNGR
jgi:C4-dicarboxylate-specific signal transduction histidine kinase